MPARKVTAVRALPVLVVFALVGCVSAPAATVPSAAALLPTAPGIHEIAIDVDGTEALGLFAVPDASSTSLIVFAHWFGGSPEGVRSVVDELAPMGAYVVAMYYRGEVGDWNAEAGAQDTLAAAQLVLREHPEIDHVVAHGFSMGGEVSGMVIARAPPGMFDHWVTGAGVMDLVDEWTKVPLFRPEIEAETGGVPDVVPDEYAARSPLALVPEIAAHGLTRVYLLHATGDAIVPFGQAEAMYAALVDAGVPVSLYEARVGNGIGLCQPECAAIPVGPAGHEVGMWPTLPLVEHRIASLGDLDAPAIRGSYDGRTGEFEPSDVP